MAHLNLSAWPFGPGFGIKRLWAIKGLCAVALLIQATGFACATKAQGGLSSIEVRSAPAGDPSARPVALVGARVSLVNADLMGAR
jgi:hypothetical protein